MALALFKYITAPITVQYSTVQYSTLQYSTEQCSGQLYEQVLHGDLSQFEHSLNDICLLKEPTISYDSLILD